MSSQPRVHGFVLSVSITQEEALRAGTSLERIAHALRVQLSAMLPAATTEYTYLMENSAHGPRPRLAATRPPAPERGLVVDLRRQRARVDGRDASLSQREFALLQALLSARGESVSRPDLIERVWGSDEASLRAVDVTVKRLRGRLARHGEAIRTVRGVGYRLDLDPDVLVVGEERLEGRAS